MTMITTGDVTSHTYSGFTTLSVEVTVDLKKTFSVMLSLNSGEVRTLCKNASHQAYRGVGRGFPTFEAARDGYKSTAAKVAIEEAETMLLLAAGDASVTTATKDPFGRTIIRFQLQSGDDVMDERALNGPRCCRCKERRHLVPHREGRSYLPRH